MKNIVESNILLAEFLGTQVIEGVFKLPMSDNYLYSYNELRFDSDWNWLMMVVDKIETYLAKCPLPTLILRGERDKIVPRDWTVFLNTVLEKGFFVEIKAGPHNIQYTHPKEVADACINFIEQ